MEAGASANVRDQFQNTPLQFAEEIEQDSKNPKLTPILMGQFAATSNKVGDNIQDSQKLPTGSRDELWTQREDAGTAVIRLERK